MPLNSKSGLVSYTKDRNALCLTEEQTKYVYKNVEQGSEISTETMKQEIDQERLTETKTEKEDGTNPYIKVVLKNVYKEEIKTMQMEFWSIVSDSVKYIKHDEKSVHNLDTETLDYRQHRKLYHSLKAEEKQMIDMDFGSNLDPLKTNYLDIYGEVHAEMIQTNRFDENSDLSTTYLGKTRMTRETKVKAGEKFQISGQSYTLGKLSDDTDCHILLDTGVSRSYRSKSFYLRCKLQHALPNFASNTQRIHVGNGQYVGVLFVILVIVDIHGHRFELFTLVSEIYEHVDLGLGIKNIFNLEGFIDLHESCFQFLNRSIPFFLKEQVILKPEEQKFVIVEAPFAEEISGMAIVKMLDK